MIIGEADKYRMIFAGDGGRMRLTTGKTGGDEWGRFFLP
jgi:hypothetical protein